MANTIILKKSSVAGKVPLSTDLQVAELAVNLADKKLYSKDASGTVIEVGTAGGSGTGSVTSVGLSLPAQFSVTGSPVTTSGTLTAAWASQTQNYVLASPTNASGVPTFRALAESDIPTLAQSKITNLTTDLAAKAPLASPTFTGTPAAPTAAVNTSTTQIATTAFVNAEIANDAAPISHVGSGGTAHANATTSVAGFMSSADKTKLDGIATGATANTGTVTSVALALPAQFSVTGSPVTGSGTLTGAWASQTANTFLSAPNGSAGTPTFRAMVAADVPELTLEKMPTASFKTAALVATTASITLSGTQTIDGVAVVAGNRVLVKDQATASQNGIYVVAAGSWARAADADAAVELAGALINVDRGTTNGGKLFTTSFKDTDTIGTTSVSWFELVFNSGTWAINTTGSAATLTTGRTIGMTGDVSYTSGSFNGSANVTGTATLANSGVTAGTYGSGSLVPVITVDAKGRLTSVTTTAVSSAPSGVLTWDGATVQTWNGI